MVIGTKHLALKTAFLFCLVVLCFVNTVNADPYEFEFAGSEYDIAPELLRAISQVESNHQPDAVNRNTNRSIDVCHMQINSIWQEKLGHRWEYLDDPAICTLVGAWILRGCVDRYGYNWNAVACYHTGYSIDDAPTEKKRANGLSYVIRVRTALGK